MAIEIQLVSQRAHPSDMIEISTSHDSAVSRLNVYGPNNSHISFKITKVRMSWTAMKHYVSRIDVLAAIRKEKHWRPYDLSLSS